MGLKKLGIALLPFTFPGGTDLTMVAADHQRCSVCTPYGWGFYSGRYLDGSPLRFTGGP